MCEQKNRAIMVKYGCNIINIIIRDVCPNNHEYETKHSGRHVEIFSFVLSINELGSPCKTNK